MNAKTRTNENEPTSRYYLDCNATVPLRDEVSRFLAALPAGGNPASVHREGRCSRRILEEARERVADWARVKPEDVVFTSGGTEANAMAVRAWTQLAEINGMPQRIAVNAGAHPSLWDNADAVSGWEIAPIMRPEVRPRTALGAEVVLADVKPCAVYCETAANNETGHLVDLEAALSEARASGAIFHVDAVQIPGKVPFPDLLREVDSFSISGHKLGAPMGGGALIVNSSEEILPLFRGGGQEFGRRPGTPPLAAVAGMGFALTLPVVSDETRAVRDAIWRGIENAASEVRGTDHGAPTVLSDLETGLPGTLLVAFPGVPGDVMVVALDAVGIAASFGSACSSGEQKVSPALLRMGVPEEIARTAVRFSCGAMISHADVADIVERIATAYSRALESIKW